MNKKALSRFSYRVLGTCGISLLLASGFSAALAAPNITGAPASRALGPTATKPGSASIPTPAALYPDVIVDGGGIHIGSTFAAFNGSAAINSTTMTTNDVCRFMGSFTLKNVGGGSPSSVGVNGFDVYTWMVQSQGPQVGPKKQPQMGNKIGNTGYFIPDLKPGTTYPQNFSFDLKPGSYIFWLSIDPYRKLKQATPGIKQYNVQLNASCGMSGITQTLAPTALRPASLHAFIQIAGVPGESKDSGHKNWIDLLSMRWQDRGTASAGNVCRQVTVSATKFVDKASPQLVSMVSSGRSVNVTFDGPDGRRELRGAMFSSVTPAGGAGGADDLPRESFSLVGLYCPSATPVPMRTGGFVR